MNEAWCTGAAALVLAGCGSSHLPSSPAATFEGRRPHSQIFNYTGTQQNFTVPKGVTRSGEVRRRARFDPRGGRGGFVTATIPVTPGETLAIFVGGGAGGGRAGADGEFQHIGSGPSGSGGHGGRQNTGGRGGHGIHRGSFPVSAHGDRGKLGLGGGGGASSYVEASATNVFDRRGVANRGNGEIVID
ncbi:MAG TPA: hypothetical protein VGX91_03630 [Candidatus Cybelea sp.]|jgi:hypothetical protein|nr:hypothetical protein [Candidatus Cybelea sp.]